MNTQLEHIIGNKEDFIHHLKSRFELYHLSNVFFRDIQYGIMSFAEGKGVKVTYGQAEEAATTLIRDLEASRTLKLIKAGSWMLNYPAFRKPSTKPSAAPAAAKVGAAVPVAAAPASPNS